MAMSQKNNSQIDPEDKVELAQIIAEKSEKLSKRYEAFGETVAQIMRWFSDWFDRILFDPKHSLFVAFGITLLVYLAFNQGSTSGVNSSAKEISNVPVSVNYNSEMYEVTGFDELVNLTLVGDYSDISMVNPQNDFNVELDLRGFAEGTHQVKYKVNSVSPRIRTHINPSTATVTIAKKEARTFQLTHDFINVDKLGSQFVLGEPELSQRDVTLRGSVASLNEVAFVRALIDVANQTDSFETQAHIVAYNARGEMLKNVDIIPATVPVKVGISSPNKTVSIKLVFEGIIPNNMAVASRTMNNEAITIYGPTAVLDKITEITIPIPASELTGDRSFVQNIVLPSGVRHGSVSKVSIDIKLGEGETRVFDQVPINFLYNVNHLSLALVDKSDPFTSIEVFGTKENLDAFMLDHVLVYLDLRNAVVGDNQVLPLFVDYVDPNSSYYRIRPVEETVTFNIIKQ